jgi:ABC-type transport system involved in multi-copper enzyme maturation permease subunit
VSGDLSRILAFEPIRARTNPVIILAVVFGLLYFVMLTLYLGRLAEPIADLARQINSPGGQDIQAVLIAILDWATDGLALELLSDRPPVLGMFFIFAMFGTPWIAMLVAADQLASDIGRRHIRFLLPRASRRDLYFGRALGAWLAWVVLLAVSLPVIGLILGALDPDTALGEGFLYSLRMLVILAFYGMPFVALMALINTFVAQAFLAYMLATGIWLVVAMLAFAASLIDESYAMIAWLLPTGTKYALMSTEWTNVLPAAGALLVYVVVYLVLGDRIFQRRDV